MPLPRSNDWICCLIHFFLLITGIAGTDGVIQQVSDEPSGFLLQDQSLNVLLTKSVLEPSRRWLRLWKGKDLRGLPIVSSKGPVDAGGAAQFEVCLNSPARLLARWVPTWDCVSLCLSVLQGEPQHGGNLLLGVICPSQFRRQLSPPSAWPFRQLITAPL